MMMYNPGRYIERYAEFGADIIYIHPDSKQFQQRHSAESVNLERLLGS